MSGVALNGLLFSHKIAQLVFVDRLIDPQGEKRTYNVGGQIFFVSVNEFLNSFDFKEDVEFVKIDLTHAHLWDRSAIAALDKVVINFRRNGAEVEVIGLNEASATLVDKLAVHDKSDSLEDLAIVLGKRGENANRASQHLGSNIERIVRSSHKACLITPKEFKSVERIMLAYDGGKSCQKALKFLMKESLVGNLELHIVTVDTGNTSRATQHIDSARDILQQANLNFICRLLEGDAESEMEQYIATQNINFVVMGAYGHNRIRQMIIGSTTAYMLRNSQIPIMLFR